jgi:dihydrolipoamide dehydrogenase
METLSAELAESYDCVVIGSGPGGYVAAIRAAQLGMSTAVVEADRIGGRCLNYACIPAKAVLRVTDVLSEIRGAGEFGIYVGPPEIDFAAVRERREKVIKTLTGGVGGLFKKNNIDFIESHGMLTGEGNVRVGTQIDNNMRDIAASAIILATGSVKKPLPGTTFGGRVIGTEEAWALDELPASIAVVGAGASGTEIASAYARLGSRVLLYEGLDRVLPTEDADISKIAERGFKKQGIEVRTDVFVENVESSDDRVTFTVEGKPAEVDYLVIAAGRAPDTEGLGLDKANIQLNDKGMIVVDGAMRTSRKGIYAIGDLVLGPALAHKASCEGVIAVRDAAGQETHPLDYDYIPRATFCSPNVASFGLTEQQARELHDNVVVEKVPFSAVGAGTVYGDRAGFVKVVGGGRYGEILGGHIVGPRAPDLIQELVVARAIEIGCEELARVVHGHPTLSEAVMEAAMGITGRRIHG